MLSPSQQMVKNITGISSHKTGLSNLYKAQISKKRLPLFERPKQENISAKYGKLDLNEYLIKNPDTTFLIRVQGDSMIGAGINTGDILVVDKEAEATSGKIVVAAINGDLLVKKLLLTENGTELHSANKDFPTIKIHNSDNFDIWGVVSSVVKPV